MNDLCAGCGKPPHQGGCRLPPTQPPPPSDSELQERRDYLQSDEFKRVRDASLAGRNPNPTVEALPGATTALHARLAKVAALLKDARAYASRRGLSPTEKLAGVRQFLDLAIEKADG